MLKEEERFHDLIREEGEKRTLEEEDMMDDSGNTDGPGPSKRHHWGDEPMDDVVGLIQIGFINMCAGIDHVKGSPAESYCTLGAKWNNIPGCIFDMTQLNNTHQP